MLSATDTIELRSRRAVDATSEAARRARKLLFQPALWQGETDARRRVAKAPAWTETAFPDALSVREVRTSRGTIGYLRLWTFDVDHSDEFLDEVDRVLRAMPRTGLIIDVRSNPGGVIEVAERLLQLFTTDVVQPVRFALRATTAVAAMADADGNGADLADWASSVSTALDLGEEYSQHLCISDPDRCNGRAVAYDGPVVVVVNPTTFSSGDIFAAGIADHGIGQVVSIGEGTGGGGANVWTERRHRVRVPRRRVAAAAAPAGDRVLARRATGRPSRHVRRARDRGHRRLRGGALRDDRARRPERQRGPDGVLRPAAHVDLTQRAHSAGQWSSSSRYSSGPDRSTRTGFPTGSAASGTSR